MINRSTEDYLKGIYTLQEENQSVATSVLAKHLKIGDGSVTDMVKKLSDRNLINYAPYQGVTLTPDGRRLALKMVRRHRLWEMFLVKFLNYSWDEIHDEAERLEHVTSDDLEERIDKALGHPKVDPHGSPIPSVSGELVEIAGKNLAECVTGERGIIVRVKDESHELLRLMTNLGLGLNTEILVKQKLEFDGTIVIAFEDRESSREIVREIPLSPMFAQSIFIQTR